MVAANIAIAGKRKEIQYLDGGIVKAIYVRDGDQIKEGAILFELDDTRVKARHTLTRGAYFSALAVQGRLVAQRDGTDSIAFATDLVVEGRQSADAAQVVANQQRIFEGRRREMAGQIEVSLERIAQLKEEIWRLDVRACFRGRAVGARPEGARRHRGYVRARLCEPADM